MTRPVQIAGAGLVAGCGDAAFRAALERLGALPVCSSPSAMRATMAADGPQWADLVRSAGLKLD